MSDMFKAIEKYIDFCIEDYRRWSGGYGEDLVESRASAYADSFIIKKGKKYYKIIRESSVHAFIVAEDDNKFRAGDILKPASWAAPAKNAARGNVFDEKYSGGWTGPGYLK